MSFSHYFDHTLLKADATPAQIRTLCQEAMAYDVYAVCVNSKYVALCKEILQAAESPVQVAAVVGFPLGAMAPAAKAFEAQVACLNGASEIDMVMDIGSVKAGDYAAVTADVAAVKEAIVPYGGVLKVILETGFYTSEELRQASVVAVKGGADFLKTSTGFGPGGASPEALAIMQEVAQKAMDAGSQRVQLKASGGIRNLATAQAMIKAGATRLGTSATLAILKEYQDQTKVLSD